MLSSALNWSWANIIAHWLCREEFAVCLLVKLVPLVTLRRYKETLGMHSKPVCSVSAPGYLTPKCGTSFPCSSSFFPPIPPGSTSPQGMPECHWSRQIFSLSVLSPSPSCPIPCPFPSLPLLSDPNVWIHMLGLYLFLWKTKAFLYVCFWCAYLYINIA